MLRYSKITLLNTTSIVWILVGIMLLVRVPQWYPVLTGNEFILSSIAGLMLGVVKSKFVFHKTILRNRNRIQNLPGENHNIFLFHSYKFYLLIVPMIGAGVFIRTSEFIPKYFVLPIYLGVGLAMVYSGIKFLFSPKYKNV